MIDAVIAGSRPDRTGRPYYAVLEGAGPSESVIASAIAYGALVRVLVDSGLVQPVGVRAALSAAMGEASQAGAGGRDMAAVLAALDRGISDARSASS
jgi:hypothetical protein